MAKKLLLCALNWTFSLNRIKNKLKLKCFEGAQSKHVIFYSIGPVQRTEDEIIATKQALNLFLQRIIFFDWNDKNINVCQRSKVKLS